MLFYTLLLSCNNSNKIKTSTNSKHYSFKQQDWKSNQITQFINDINYTATEVPLKYYLLKNIDENDLGNVDSIYNANSKERILEIEFQHANKEDLLKEKYTQKSYEDAVKYLSFQIEKDFTLITSSNDTIQCSGAHFERNFKVAPFKRALLYFTNINPNDNIKLIYQDQLFGNGIIKFNFQEIPLKL
nr:hypothetical protein [uncultured Psychroserpens sp.]